MSNVTFAKSVDGFVSMQKKGEGAFGSLVMFAHELLTSGVTGKADDVLKSTIDAEEKAYKSEHPKMEAFPTAYRSAKSVIMGAVKCGVSLMGEDGKPKGKSQLEKEVKEAKGDSGKSAAEKFQVAMQTAFNVFADVDTLEDILKCKRLLAELADTVTKAESAAKAGS